jgi:RecJ-like exonuclease
MSATKTCLVCAGDGSFVATFTVVVGHHLTDGPDEQEVTDLIICDDCKGSGLVEQDVHLEQTGERLGDVEAWRDSMIENHVERLWGV